MHAQSYCVHGHTLGIVSAQGLKDTSDGSMILDLNERV